MRSLEARDGVRYEIVEQLSDEGFSGKNTNRPGYQKMWGLVSSQAIDFVVATELSRISRSVVDFLQLLEHCQRNKVDVFILGLQLDTASIHGKMILTVLAALAQFEREMTSQRVREYARARLLKDGKINGSAEILGLDKDPNRKGHVVPNPEELKSVQRLLELFVALPGKKQVLNAAQEKEIAGKRGGPISQHVLDILLENARWRYRGFWYLNRDSEHVDPALLPEAKRFQAIPLPHGPLIDTALLDRVEAKLRNTYLNRKRTGKDNHTYLLSHILYHEDGSRYTGQPAKNREYRYYHNRKNNLRIRCDEIEPAIVKRVKDYFIDNELFAKLVEKAIRNREEQLPRIDAEVQRVRKQLKDLEESEADLRRQLLDPEVRSRHDFVSWLAEQIDSITTQKEQQAAEIDNLERLRTEALKSTGLENLFIATRQFVDKFDHLTGTERRNFVERILKRIVVRNDNVLDFEVFEDPTPRPVTDAGRMKSTDRSVNGGSDGTRTHDLRRDRATL
jgi:DNA invertase Pin-like site-specific DNA recombinase